MNSKITRWLYAALALMVVPAIAFAQPANDNCAGAIPISFINAQGTGCGAPTTLAFTVDGTTDSGVPTVCSNPGLDQWFTWTATSTGLSFDSQNPGSPGIAIFASCADATAGIEIDCANTFAAANLSGWAIGDNLIIQIYDFNGSSSDVAFCLEEFTPPPPPANDDCGGAISLTVNPDLACAVSTPGTIASATASPEDPAACGGTEDDDVWYSFEATSTTHTIDLLNAAGSTTDLYHSLWEGTCGALTSTGLCSDPNTSTATGLTVGSTYFLRVYSWTATSGQNTTFDVCIGIPPAPPANDDCADAIALTMSPDDLCINATPGTTSSALPSNEEDCSTTNKDVWYTFTPATSGSYNFSVTETFDSGFGSTYISVHEGLCGALTDVTTACFSTAHSDLSLTAGTTYFVNVRYTSTATYSDFDVCVFPSPPPPPNDDCSGATPVTLGSLTCGPTVTANNASATGIAGDVCGSTSTLYGDGDIWFSFEADGPTAVLDLISEPGGGTAASMYLSVYDDCGGNCVYNNNFVSTTALETISGLTAGETYYIRMYESGNNVFGSFEFCMFTPPPPPVNDVCAGAIPAIVGANGTCPTGAGAYAVDFSQVTQSGEFDPSCGNFSEYDLWYTWTATAASIEFTSGTGFPDLAIFTGACGSLTEVGCLSTSGTAAGLTIGEEYIIMIHDGTAGATLVEWCLQEGPACGDPTDLEISNIAEFTADVTFSAIASGGHTVEYGITGFTPGTGTTVAVPTGGAVTLTGLLSMTGYDVYVSADCGSAVLGPEPFTTLGPPPANDLCGGATPVTLGANGVCGPTVMADNSNATGIAGDVCGSTSLSYGGADIWFSFVAGGSTALLDLISEPGGLTSPSMYISVYDDCGGNCVYNNNFISTTSNETITGLTAGETYFIRMYDFGANDFGAFEFCMSTPPPPPVNDICSGAIPATVGGLGTCPAGAGAYSEDFTFVSAALDFPSCDGFGNYNLWYTWTATATSIDFTSGTGLPGMAVWEGSCGTLTELGCLNNISGTISGLTIGTEYYIEVWDDTQGVALVEWCLEADVVSTAAVAPAAGCEGTINQMVDGSGTPAVIDFIDANGDIYASVSNNEPLGMTAVSLYGGAARQFGTDFYLDRNVSIVPTTQPNAAVTVTMYALNTEITALINASQTAGTAVNSVGEMQFVKVSGTASCSPTYPGGATQVSLSATPYGTDWAFSGTVTSFSEFFVLPSLAPLPVELASFNAYAAPTGNVVEWTAATEIDFFMYTVERATDPASFSALAEVAPKGTEFSEAVYTSQDLNPSAVTYYRLRMEDLDGAVEYSDVVAVTRDDISGGIKMFPNPAKEHVTFEVLAGITDNGTISVVLTDLNGRSVREWSLAAGQRTSVSLSGIPSGVYMVSSVSAAGTASQRLVID